MTRLPLAVGLTVREVRSRYQESALGLLWTLLTPLLLIAIYSFFFGRVLGLGGGAAGGVPFALHLFSGYLAWDVFGRTVGEGPDILTGNRAILTKVRVPLETVFHARVLFQLFHASLAGLVLFAAMAVEGIAPGPEVLLLPVLLACLGLFTAGAAMIAGVLGLFLKDLKEVVAVVLLAWLFATPIFYYEAGLGLGEGTLLGTLYRSNPMYWFVTLMRACTVEPGAGHPLAWVLVVLGSYLAYRLGRLMLARSRSLVLDLL
ncbi:MAG: ABC transporter permease [Planctomycetota bacterium]